MKSIARVILLVVALLAVAGELHAGQPLRIWVMHNEVRSHDSVPTAEEIRQGLESWRRKGIVIENGVGNLLLDNEAEHPFADYVFGNNSTLAQLEAFLKENPDVPEVRVEFIRWQDGFNRILAALRSDGKDNAPDIIQGGWIGTFAGEGLLADVSEYFNTQDYFPASISNVELKEKSGLFGVPWFLDVRLLYYRKEMIKDASAFSDWKHLTDECARFKRPGARLIGFSTAMGYNLLHNLAPWLWSAGGGIVEDDASNPFFPYRVAIDSPESLKAMGFLKSLADSGCAAFTAGNQEALDEGLINGSYAAIISGPWLMKMLGDGWQGRYGVSMPPAGPAGSFPFLGGSYLAVTSKSLLRGNLASAVRLIRHLTSTEAQTAFMKATGLIPASRESLSALLSDEAMRVFKQALETDRFYPAMPDWGSVVENELINSHIWQLWRDIAEGVPDDTLARSARNAATFLKSRLAMSMAYREREKIAAAAGLLVLVSLSCILWLRGRNRRMIRQLEDKSFELASINSERAMLEARAIFLGRRQEEQGQELATLRGEIDRLSESSLKIAQQIEEAKAARTVADTERICEVSILSNGTVLVAGQELNFDNNRQARRLIEHLSRQACMGIEAVHCLWGYLLFGWESSRIQSPPQRLFDTMVAKINSSLKGCGIVPMIRKKGRNTGSWALNWEIGAALERMDVHRASSRAEEASRSLCDGEIPKACAYAIAAAELDPKNIDALMTMKEIAARKDDEAREYRNQLNSALNAGIKLLRHELEGWLRGMQEVDAMFSEGRLPRGINFELASESFAAIRQQVLAMQGRIERLTLAATATGGRMLLMDEISQHLLAIQGEICALKTRGVSDAHMWSCIVDSQQFTNLLAIPRIRDLVNSFYNQETETFEDPRLVQLALISMISKPSSIQAIFKSRDERELIVAINRGLRRHLITLEDQFGSAEPM